MDDSRIIEALSALAQPSRLQAFCLLVEKEPDGIAAGELARLIGAPQNTMSAHLLILKNAGLITSERISRSIVYRADLVAFRAITLSLLQDCCGGRPEICAPIIAELTPCCPPQEASFA